MKHFKKITLGLLVITLLTSPLMGVLSGMGDEGVRYTPEYYHNAMIHLNLTDENGTPASGYIIQFAPDNSYFLPAAMSDHIGQASLDIYWESLGPGNLYVRDTMMKYLHFEHITVYPDQIMYKNITIGDPIPHDRTVTGRVYNSLNGIGLAGVEVRLRGYDTFGSAVTETNITDQDGNYEIALPLSENRPYQLRAMNSGYNSFFRYFYTMNDTLEYSIDMPLLPDFEVNGDTRIRYLNASTGVPFNSGTVKVDSYPESRDHQNYYQNLGSPGPNGWFGIDSGLGEATTRFMLDIPEYEGSQLTVSNSYILNGTPSDIVHEIMIPKNKTVNINVVNESGPISGAWVNLNGNLYNDDATYSFYHSGITDANGTDEFAVPANGSFSLEVGAWGHESRYSIVETYDDDPTEMTIEMEEYGGSSYDDLPKGDVEIIVMDEVGGFPVKDASITGSIGVDHSYYYIYEYANDTGVFKGELPVGHYDNLQAFTVYGRGYTGPFDVVEGSNDPITINLEWYEEKVLEDPEQYHITFMSYSGTPVANVPIMLKTEVMERVESHLFMTDDDGRIYFNADPASSVSVYSYFNIAGKFNRWLFEDMTFEDISGSGGSVGTVILYESGEPKDIFGSVFDSVTGEPIQAVSIEARSYHPTGEGSRMMMGPSYTTEGIELFYHHATSTLDGNYRTWGSEKIYLEASREGYYPNLGIVNLGTRATTEHDIYLDPLPVEKVWFNGTVVDDHGEGILATVYAYDNDHEMMMPQYFTTEVDGTFSSRIYPGNYTLEIMNDTLMVTENLEISDDMNDVELILYSQASIWGNVNNSMGDPIPGVDIILEVLENDEFRMLDNTTSNETGFFDFVVRSGIYRIRVYGSDLYDDHIGDNITADGWNDIEILIVMNNRTIADVQGTVLGGGGYLADGIPDTVVTLIQDGNVTMETISDGNGNYRFTNVSHGIYQLHADPPENLEPQEGIRSGYLDTSIANLTITGALVEKDLVLPYIAYNSSIHVNVTYKGPNGTGVYLDEPIMIEFSIPMDIDSVQDGLRITPQVNNLTFVWDYSQTFVIIYHDRFNSNTEYTISIGYLAISYSGYPMWEPVEWSFITGNTTDPWEIFSVNVTMDDMKNVTVEALAPSGLTIFFVLENVGYRELVEETNGTYTLFIQGHELAWDFEHHYFFTKTDGGFDMAPDHSGVLLTPEEPPKSVVWSITSVDIDIRETGTWDVSIQAPEGLKIYIVIHDAGSFLVPMDAPGYYRVLIPYEYFEWDREYKYHFSDSEDGPDMDPSLSGSVRTPLEPKAPEGDDDPPFILCCIGILLIIVIIIIIVMIMIRKKDTGPFDEE